MSNPTTQSKRLIVAVTGASGAIYARRMIEVLANLGHEVHVVVSPLGQRLLHDELSIESITAEQLAPAAPQQLHLHNVRDVGATIASGSFRCDGMIIVPCSSNSLAAVASGLQQNLVHRAAAVTIKERRPLVLVHRETPLTLADIRNMETVTLAGAVIFPASPGFYLMPQGINELVDFVVGRVLDLFDITHDLAIRWKGEQQGNDIRQAAPNHRNDP